MKYPGQLVRGFLAFPKQLIGFADKIAVKQKRLENRDLCADLVKMTWTPNLDQSNMDWAILGDISPSGACLEIDEPIPVDTVVELEFGEERCRAIVRYCKYDKVNYLLGVEFEPGYSWSSSRWEPKHLVRIYYTHEAGYHLLTAIFHNQKRSHRKKQSIKHKTNPIVPPQ